MSTKKQSKKPAAQNTALADQNKKQKPPSNETKPIPEQTKNVDNNAKQKTVANEPSKKDTKTAQTKQPDPKANQPKKQTASTKKIDISDQAKQKQKTQRSQKPQQKQKAAQQPLQGTPKQTVNSKSNPIKKLDTSPEKTQMGNQKKKRNEDYEQGDDVLKMSGILDAYEQFLKTLCKYGLPTGDVYEFAAQQIEKFQRKKRAKELKLKAQMQIQKAARKKQELQKQKQQKKPTKL